MTFDTVRRTMMDVPPPDAYRHLRTLPEVSVAVSANCGVPEFKDGAFTYIGTPELMAGVTDCPHGQSHGHAGPRASAGDDAEGGR